MEAGNLVKWARPGDLASPVIHTEQLKNIREHGDGPFRVTRTIPICGGQLVEFTDQNGKIIKVNQCWLFVIPPFCPQMQVH